MAKPKPSHGAITEAEWDVLNALWELGPTTARQVADHVRPSRGWAYSTVKTMLDRMVEKDLVTAHQIGNVWEFRSAMGPLEARRSAWRRFVNAAFGGAQTPALEFIASELISPKERARLLDLLRTEQIDE